VPGTDALVARLAHGAETDEGLPIAERVEVHEVVFGFESPSEARLLARGQALAERLARLFPERSYEVVVEFDPDTTPSWAPLRRRRLGWLHVLARSTGRSGIAHAAWDDDALGDPSRIVSARTRMATLLARGRDDRLAALSRELGRGAPDVSLAEALADALLVAFAAEHLAALRHTRGRGGLDADDLRARMRTLEAFSSSALLGDAAPGSPAFAIVVDLAARARLFARTQARLWERIPGIAWTRRAALLVALVDERIEAFLALQATSPALRRALEDACTVRERELREAWKAARTEGVTWSEFGRRLCLRPSWDAALTLDETLVLEHAPRALLLDAWRSEEGASSAAERARDEASARLDGERARLLLTVSTDALLGEAEEEPAEREAPDLHRRRA
jgi:hypothetical protein